MHRDYRLVPYLILAAILATIALAFPASAGVYAPTGAEYAVKFGVSNASTEEVCLFRADAPETALDCTANFVADSVTVNILRFHVVPAIDLDVEVFAVAYRTLRREKPGGEFEDFRQESARSNPQTLAGILAAPVLFDPETPTTPPN